MLLGDLIARFEDPDFAGETIAALNDLTLTARIAEIAAGEKLSPGEYVRCAVERYASGASEDEWLTLMAQMSKAGDPGAIFLRRSLAYDIHQSGASAAAAGFSASA